MFDVDFIAVSAVIGGLLPLVISLLKNLRRTWPTQVVRVFALVVAGVLAFVQVGVDLGWTGIGVDQVAAAWGIIYALAQTTYTGLWKDTTTEQTLASVGNAQA